MVALSPPAAGPRCRPRRARRPRYAALAAAVAALLTAGAATARETPEGGPAGADTQARAAFQAAFLAAEVDAARSRQLYLVLDPAASVVEVRAEGLTLLTLTLDAADLVHGPGGPEPRWAAAAYRLEGAPPSIVRPDLTPPPPGVAAITPPAVPVQPGAPLDFRARQRRELLDRAPASYLLRFVPLVPEGTVPGGAPPDPPGAGAGTGAPILEVAVAGDGAGPPGTGGWREGWQRLAARLGGPRPPDRLRLALPADAARRLALTLQADVRLLVAPPPAPVDPGPPAPALGG